MDIRDRVKEIAEIAASLPENMQQLCFEMLLSHHLASETPPSPPVASPLVSPPTPSGIDPGQIPSGTSAAGASGQADLTNNDLHVKARRFMEKYSVALPEVNNLFYKEGEAILPLYEDLKTTRMAESQIRIALLQALRSALSCGEFQADVEAIRTECRDRKAYDSANFAANFTNNKSLFDFDKYIKGTTSVRLSEDGRKELANLIKELQ